MNAGIQHWLEILLSMVMALLALGFGLFCGLMALQIFTGHIRAKREARESQSWSMTEGKVVSAKVEHMGIRAGWKAVIHYTYQVNGETYNGDRLAHDYFDTKRLKEAQADLTRYPKHGMVAVYFDPAHPQVSVLERVDHGDGWGMLWVPFFLLFPTFLCSAVGITGVFASFK